jgi:hypothetical protein
MASSGTWGSINGFLNTAAKIRVNSSLITGLGATAL